MNQVRGGPHVLQAVARAARETVLDLVDLVLPSPCAGCGAAPAASGICHLCAVVLADEPGPVRPTPAPEGLPPCFAMGDYDGPLRDMILAYKERGRRELAGPLGDGLAAVVWATARSGGRSGTPLILVPVPATAAAVRARHGDHMRRLALHAARRLRAEGWQVGVAVPVRALPRADSTHLDRIARARSAQEAFVGLPQRLQALRSLVAQGATVVLLDDVVTTGSTLAALAVCLARGAAAANASAVLAATQLRHGAAGSPIATISPSGVCATGR